MRAGLAALGSLLALLLGSVTGAAAATPTFRGVAVCPGPSFPFTVEAQVSGLEPNTSYVLRVMFSQGPTAEVPFRTNASGNQDEIGGSGRERPWEFRVMIFPDPNNNTTQDPGEAIVLDQAFVVDRPCHDARRVPVGKITVGSSFGLLDHNDKYGSRYYLLSPAPVTIVKLRAYLDGLGRTTGSQLVRGLIYRHTPTGPGALVARTFQVRLPAGLPAGWVDLPFPFPPTLAAGGYWLTLHAGEAENILRYAFDPKPGGQRHNDDLFSNGPLNPFGGSDSAAREMSIHAVER